MHDVDIAIIGGGPIGLAAGIALDALGYRVQVIERRAAQAALDDRRILALSEGSRLILSRLGVWQRLSQATPITTIEVSDAQHPARVTLRAEEARVCAMGHVTTFNRLHAALCAQIDSRAPALVRYGLAAEMVEATANGVHIKFEGEAAPALTAKLAIHAEGTSGATMANARIKDYGQWAVVSEVWREHPAGGTAYEHFTERGPLALLPFDDHHALIWTVSGDQHEEILALDDDAFLAKLNPILSPRCGTLTRVSRRGGFALTMRMAHEVTASRQVFLGNAAQQLHPVAAQGFNLGLRDVWTLRERLWNHPADPGAAQLLSKYARERRADRLGSLWMTDGMIAVFGSTNPLLRAGRGAALHALGAIGSLRAAFARRMMLGSR